MFFHTASLLLIYRLTIRLSAAEEEKKGADGEIKQKRRENDGKKRRFTGKALGEQQPLLR
uniref:Uncharacterized protein n=1 Tax=Sparus aurata TaxID=8175 RepID=A0A671YQ12_SPAAU